MRRSDATARRTWSTSAPTTSQTLATSFMNEMRVASIAFAAYLHSSALAQSIIMIGAPVRVNGAYSSFMISAGALVLGADHDAVGLHEVVDRRALLQELGVADDAEGMRRLLLDDLAHPLAVPTGTVLLSTMTL